MKQNIIREKSVQFALSMINLYVDLKNKNEYVISKQLLRSGTSIGANIEEAIAGQSRKDFIMKLTIASKEARETKYRLFLLQKSQIIPGNYQNHLGDIESIINILTKIIMTTSSTSK